MQLAQDLRRCRSSGIFNKAAEAEIDELHWKWLREQEAETMERKAAAQARRRDAAKARKTRLRSLLGKLRSSKSRCDCNDFAHWYGLWRCNPQLAIRLRSAGHHFMHCRLARDAKQPFHVLAPLIAPFSRQTCWTWLASHKEYWADSCLGPDTGEEAVVT